MEIQSHIHRSSVSVDSLIKEQARKADFEKQLKELNESQIGSVRPSAQISAKLLVKRPPTSEEVRLATQPVHPKNTCPSVDTVFALLKQLVGNHLPMMQKLVFDPNCSNCNSNKTLMSNELGSCIQYDQQLTDLMEEYEKSVNARQQENAIAVVEEYKKYIDCQKELETSLAFEKKYGLSVQQEIATIQAKLHTSIALDLDRRGAD